MRIRRISALFFLAVACAPTALHGEDEFELELRHRTETAEDSGRFHTFWRKAKWDPNKTAIIVCDMWDSHHSVTAVRRVNELAPHLNEVLKAARERGATVIHAPSDCMEHYEGHAARARAKEVPKATENPEGIADWSYRIASEVGAKYPLDQSDGGEDEDAWENAQWNATLKAEGREPGTPWLAQHPALEIGDGDYIAAEGDVVWNVLQHEGIEHVALTGVHTNMCVLGRPFGLRRMVSAGIDTVLVRDCTDLMYNPERWPFVNHFTGLDLIVEYIEAHVCPTITSDQLLGGEAFRFSGDRRPHVAFLIGEKEYETVRTVPQFARRFLGKDFRVSIAHADEENRNLMPGVRMLEEADVLFVSVRRRGLPEADLARIRRFVASGKPVVGIRTASHAFAPKEELEEGHADWANFDPDVFGGNYSGHHGSGKRENPDNLAWVTKGAAGHPVVRGVPEGEWKTTAWLYKTSPLAAGAQVLAMGRVEGVEQPEPLAWTYVRAGGGKSFYTSLGHVDDFEDPNFLRMLVNAIYWATGMESPEELPEHPDRRRWEEGWQPVMLGGIGGLAKTPADESLWLRTLVRVPDSAEKIQLRLDAAEVFINGKAIGNEGEETWTADPKLWQSGNPALIACKLRPAPNAAVEFAKGASLIVDGETNRLDDLWQARFLKAGEDGSKFPIPPQFGAPADLIQTFPGPLIHDR